MKARVFVGLSGGVDSGTSAALLKERGFDVTGVFIKIWRPEFIECTWKEDRLDAMRVCAALSIPFRELDLSNEYKKEVIDSMLRDYAAGITPNPDVLCNKSIKFGAFARWAKVQGAEFVATGHYARIRQQGGHFELLRGVDAEKDQSYFLHRLVQADLSRALFPVGGMKKPDVRRHARRLGVPVAEKRDSQGLCFVGDVSMPDFLARFLPLKEGAVLDMRGREIGTHEGAAAFTIGERHGFTITEAEASKKPHYVVSVDTERNTIVVSDERADCMRTRAALKDMHWVYRAPQSEVKLFAQARYREAPFPVKLLERAGLVQVESAEPHLYPPGQSLVCYFEDVCLGGGIIQKGSVRAEAAPAEKKPKLSTAQPVRSIVRRVQ